MSAPPVTDYSEYTGKKVILTLKDPNDPKEGSVEVEGQVQAATAVGMLFKPKGRTTSDIIEPGNILGCELVSDDRKVVVKYIKEVNLGATRSHLADRHGFLLSMVNDLTEEAATEAHVKQHAEYGKDLGHIHGERPRTQRDNAIAQAAEAKTEEPQPEQLQIPGTETMQHDDPEEESF